MRGDGLFAETVGELARDAFGHAPGVDEHQRRAVLLDELGQARVNFLPHLVRHHRLERRSRNFQAQIAPTLMPRVDDRNLRGRRAVRRGAGEKMGDRFDRILRSREPDALQAVAAQSREPLQRKSEMGAAFVRRDGMDFVDDHRPGVREHRAPGLRAEQNVKRFRRRHQDMRRAAAHPLALGDGRVPRSDPGADIDIGKPAPAELLPDAGQRRLEILMDVVRQRLERRHVDDLRRIRERRLETLPHQVVDRRQKGRERLARSRGRRDEGVAAGLDRRPRFGLRGGRRGETLGEPVRDRRVEQGLDAGRRSRRSRALRPRRFAPLKLKLSRSASCLVPHGRGWNCARLYMAPDRTLVTLAHCSRDRRSRLARSEAPAMDRAYKCSLAECGGLRQVSRLFRREVQTVRVRQQFAPPNWESIYDQ